MIHRSKLFSLPILLSIIFLFFSYVFIVRNYFSVPKDRYYYGSVYTTPLDFLGGLVIATKGYTGHFQNYLSQWSLRPDITEQHGIEIVKFEYILIGLGARLFGIEPVTAMLISRLFFTIGLLYTMYRFLSYFLHSYKERIVGFLFSLFAVGVTWPWEGWNNGAVLAGIGDSIWPFHRYTFVAHHYLLSQITMLWAVLFLMGYLEKKNIRNFVLSIICGMITTVIFLPSSILLVASSFFPILVSETQKKVSRSKQLLYKSILFALFTGCIFIPGFIVYQNVSHFVNTEWMIVLRWNMWNYITAVGLVWVFAIIAIPQILKTKKPIGQFVVSALILHPILAFILQYFGLFSIKRMFQTPYFILFAGAGAIGLSVCMTFIQNVVSKRQAKIIFISIVCAIILSGYRTYYLSTPVECFCDPEESRLPYPKKVLMDAIVWIKNHTNSQEVVMTGFDNGLLVSAFAGNTTMMNTWLTLIQVSHYYHIEMKAFYGGLMNEYDMKNFIKAHTISYVLYGEEEKKLLSSGGAFPYKGLEKKFDNGNVSIYSVPGDWKK
jgi:hypothetical protein